MSSGLDQVTKTAIETMARRFPRASIRFTHQFLDGTDGKECGFVPNDWDGSSVLVAGEWWKAPGPKIFRSEMTT